MDQRHRSVLVATLGGQPQLVTFALDTLLARDEPIREVIVLYLSAVQAGNAYVLDLLKNYQKRLPEINQSPDELRVMSE